MSGFANDANNPRPPRSKGLICYSHNQKDQEYLRELQGHLAYYIQKGELEVWDDTQIRPGADRRYETGKALQSAKVAVLLVSADFFASERIMNGELPALLAAARDEGLSLLCVLLSFSAFEDSELRDFQAINTPSNPLSQMTRAQRDKVWRSAVEALRKLLAPPGQETTPKQSALSPTTTPARSSPVENHEATRPIPAGQDISNSRPPACDICIICAMPEEVKAFIHEASRLFNVPFETTTGPHTRREYRYTTISNNKKEPLTLYVTWPPRYGPEATGLHLQSALEELKPRFAGMTGICAGDRQKVALGDIVVAERAFRYDTGKIVSGRGGRKVQAYDALTQNLDPNILQFVGLFDGWKQAVADLQRPISRHQQRDWLLTTLLHEATPRVDDIPLAERERHAPDWQKLLHDLQSASPPYLKANRTLDDPARVRELYFGKEAFPFQDPPHSQCHIAPIASGSVVRSDNPFEEIRVPVRDTIAVDMEGATFYRTVAESTGIRSLLVKGISDYADAEKDDSYHQYASAASAIYMLSFIKEYVNNERMPRIDAAAP